MLLAGQRHDRWQRHQYPWWSVQQLSQSYRGLLQGERSQARGFPPPGFQEEVFFGSSPTVYYLPGMAGWSTTFAGVSTALWLPQVQTGNASFGAQTNRFGFTISWANDKVVVIEASPDLANPAARTGHSGAAVRGISL
jgi:hypothetical protein